MVYMVNWSLTVRISSNLPPNGTTPHPARQFLPCTAFCYINHLIIKPFDNNLKEAGNGGIMTVVLHLEFYMGLYQITSLSIVQPIV